MNPDELRALADALRPMAKAPCFDGIDIESAADYLRAQAEVQPVPAAWRDPDTGELSRIGRVRWRPLYAHPAPAVPAGWKLVPVEPTPEMLHAEVHGSDWNGMSGDERARAVWAAVLAAAPAAPQAEPSLGELMREQRRSRIVAGAYPDGNPNAGAMMAQTPQAEPCIGNDPTCPCQDGDACHYRDAADGTKGWPVPQAEPIDPHMIVAEDRFPDVPAERWKPCPQCDGDFDRECPICDGLGKVLATDGEQAEPKPTPASGDDLGVYKGMADSYRNDAEQAELKREPLTALRILEIEDEATRKWRDNGRIIEYAIVFARMIERAAYERAAQECLATAAELRRCADGCTDGRYDWKADGALDCADAIRALGRQHD